MIKIRIGTRKSALALAQTELVMEALRQIKEEIEFELVPLTTKGDKILNKPLLAFGGKGVFVEEFEEGIKEGTIDIAVHSAKDMPMELLEGLEISAVLQREDARDVLVRRANDTGELKVVGTSSLRRQIQIKEVYPSVLCKDIRGNVGTRLEKLKRGEYDGIVLAAAGLKRLGLLDDTSYTFEYFACEQFIPAGGQGIIAIEGRKGAPLTSILKKANDEIAKLSLETEREVLRLLEAGCHEPIGVYSKWEGTQVTIYLMVEKDGVVKRVSGTALRKERFALVRELVGKVRE